MSMQLLPVQHLGCRMRLSMVTPEFGRSSLAVIRANIRACISGEVRYLQPVADHTTTDLPVHRAGLLQHDDAVRAALGAADREEAIAHLCAIPVFGEAAAIARYFNFTL